MRRFININGALIPGEEASLPATSRAVSYGDGCFETLVSYKSKFLHFEDHFARLQSGLKYLEMNLDLTIDQLMSEIRKLLEENELEDEDSVIRIQCYREGSSGYFDISDRSSFIISNRSIPQRSGSLKLKTVSVRAIPTTALERKVKLSNSINYIKAAQEAKKKEGDDALMLTVDSKISETTISNIFWIKGNQVFTPSVNCDLLPGVTRSILIELIDQDSELELIEGAFGLEEIYSSEAVFCTNSVMEMKPVASVDDHYYKTEHSLFEKLKNDFKVYKEKWLC
ncbi:MAG: aminotransferase class IV [Balneola sp.]|jgi:branched-subunit amino acid aminotransferase/4-amino-4-deoxychorismate lyase